MELILRILLVEDSKFFAKAVLQGLSSKFNADVTVAYSRAEARKHLSQPDQTFDFAMVDIVLPDCDKGEVVDDVLSRGIPTVVFTGGISPELRESLLKKPIVDYVLKNSPSSLNYLFNLMERLVKNTTTHVLVVDDSRSYRMFVKTLLERYRLIVHEADGAESAMDILASNPQIQLALVDQNMPKVTGIELIKQIRKTRGPESLGIIGLSSNKNANLSVQFIKYGANDFLPKDFRHEELFCRVSQNLNMLDMLSQLKAAATTDFLTGLPNRSQFYTNGGQLLSTKRDDQGSLLIAMMDLDYFKKVNDTYGHDIGDIVLKRVADCLREHVNEDDIVARIGGEEFALILQTIEPENANQFFERLRDDIASIFVECAGQRVPVSCSIGVVGAIEGALEPILKRADELLYVAKKHGRNRVEFCEELDFKTEEKLAS